MRETRPNVHFDIAVDNDSQTDRFKRQNNDNDDNDGTDLTPSHPIPNELDSAATITEPAPKTSPAEPQPSLVHLTPLLGIKSFQIVPRSSSRLHPHSPITSRPPPAPSGSQTSPSSSVAEPKSSNRSTSAPNPQSSSSSSSNPPTTPSPRRRYSIAELEALNPAKQPDDDGENTSRKWEPKEWDDKEFDSDEENMSLAVTMKLANELSLLKSFLEMYRKFNVHLGDIASGPRHRGFLFLISSTVTRLESHSRQLRTLRDERQRGNPAPSGMERIVDKIAYKCRTRREDLWDVMEEKVDMADEVARAVWVKKKKAVLGDVMGGLVGYLEELGDEEGWKEREVGRMGERWEKRWKLYGAMDRADLKTAGWILEVGKRDGC